MKLKQLYYAIWCGNNFLTMITTFGVKENDYFDEHIQQNLTMEALF